MADTTIPPGESPGGTTINVDVPKTEPSTETTGMTFRSPKKYKPTLPSSTTFKSPPLEWLEGTWTVAHSTLPMWRKAKNVRITYKIIPPKSPSGHALLDDEVNSVPTARNGFLPQPTSIKGIDTPDGDGGWDWRGKGWLKIASAHWEIVGWGEKDGEKWAVTWFAPSIFTPAGMDIYSWSKDGMSEALYQEIMKGLGGLEAKDLADKCKKEMFKLVID